MAENVGKSNYTRQTLGNVTDNIKVAPACIACHNAHKHSPRTDFKPGDVWWVA